MKRSELSNTRRWASACPAASIVAFGLLAACGGEAAPPPAIAPTKVEAAKPAAPTPAPASPREGPALAVLLRPVHDPTPHVHVEVDIAPPPSMQDAKAAEAWRTWRILRTAPDRLSNALAKDDQGDLGVQVAAAGNAVELTLSRAPSGIVRVAYDVRANAEAPDDPLGQLVLDDRFRGAGEGLIALPGVFEDTPVPTTLRIDGEPLRAPNAASSLGVGATRRTTLRPRALRYASFLAGSMGAAVYEDPSAGRDEAAWLGYTSFDPRPATAEIAQIRDALGEAFKQHDETPWAYLLVSQTRPIGSFSTTVRAASVLVQVGPSEPWNAPLRLSIAQQLAHRWIGGELRLASAPSHDAESWWFNDGIARYMAMHVLARLGLFTPADVRAEIGGQLSVLATAGSAKRTNAELAADAVASDVARAVLVARGALYAAREAAIIRARTKGEKGLDSVLLGLAQRANQSGAHSLAIGELLDALAKEDPDAPKSYDAFITRGAPIELPANALGPCFRAGSGEYVAFDPGFDVVATRESKDSRVVGLRTGGPSAKAGLREGDVVEAMTEREGDADVPVKIVVSRDGAKVNVTYSPRGTRGRGQTWTRVLAVPDDRCGEPL